jgi:tripartite-type tricarboxylate transporter receptor subunit TctC
MQRRLFLALWALLASLALAQPYPSKPVRILVPYPPGSTPDIVGRTLSDRLQLASAPQMLVVKPDLKLADFKSFLEHARKNPGRLSYASVGSGSASHLTMELLKSDAGRFIVHIPYRGFPSAVADLLAGNIDAMSRSSRWCWPSCAPAR